MLLKPKALYQVKTILDYLPKEEYKLIPQKTIDYIENNFEYDENFSINPNIPIEKQKIDSETYEMLEKIVKSTEITKRKNKPQNNAKINTYIQKVKESNQNYNARIENIRLNKLVNSLKKENAKLPKAKKLLLEYKKALKEKCDETEKLKNDNQDLYNCIQGLPKIIKKKYVKDLYIKSLNNEN